ncbi:50S ribosomal protein L25/general stress protein Ctc [Amphibacillus sediminis]|uniref:50S ribosomal protein L25/general stress protein Ctc n=1 Tax=Amphibacillus sediminis TaxID=360185 RepID=UPI00082E5115|nr:50S ribosomal protein L25/general stress protein Ctc [Amphibacillus sediminis]
MAVTLKADRRENLSKSSTKRLRHQGFIPAIVYGKKQAPITVSVNSIDLVKTVRDQGKNAVISLDLGEQNVDVMLHDYQVEPINDQLIHADFYVVDMSQEIDVMVPVRVTGDAQGVKDGGVLQQPLYELSVRAKPAQIPEEITVDITGLNIGDSVVVSDLKDSGDYEVLDDDNMTIVTVTAPDVEVVEPVDEDEAAEPELVEQKGDSKEE